MTDPMELIIKAALMRAGFNFTEECGPGGEANHHLDFYLPDYGVHIEVKQFHSPRISEQMSRVPNVIAIQGHVACDFFASVLYLLDGRAWDQMPGVEG